MLISWWMQKIDSCDEDIGIRQRAFSCLSCCWDYLQGTLYWIYCLRQVFVNIVCFSAKKSQDPRGIWWVLLFCLEPWRQMNESRSSHSTLIKLLLWHIRHCTNFRCLDLSFGTDFQERRDLSCLFLSPQHPTQGLLRNNHSHFGGGESVKEGRWKIGREGGKKKWIFLIWSGWFYFYNPWI